MIFKIPIDKKSYVPAGSKTIQMGQPEVYFKFYENISKKKYDTLLDIFNQQFKKDIEKSDTPFYIKSISVIQNNSTLYKITGNFLQNQIKSDEFLEPDKLNLSSLEKVEGPIYINIEKAEKRKKPKIEVNYNTQTVSHGESYSHIPTKVQCRYCQAKFLHTELNYDWIDDDFGYQDFNNGCPKCGQWDCCEIEYESWHEINK